MGWGGGCRTGFHAGGGAGSQDILLDIDFHPRRLQVEEMIGFPSALLQGELLGDHVRRKVQDLQPHALKGPVDLRSYDSLETRDEAKHLIEPLGAP